MKEDIKNKWVAALRSGEYNQTDGVLKNANGHCCLGVLCEIYIKENNNASFVKDDQKNADFFHFVPEEHNTPTDYEVLPKVVQRWAGIKTPCGQYSDETSVASKRELTKDNDEDKSFETIADIIEKEWENL